MQNCVSEPNHLGQAATVQTNTTSAVIEWQAEAARLREEKAQLAAELRREHEMHVQNLADFDNYRRRVERERTQAAQASKRELILPLLDVLDDFEQVIRQAQEGPQALSASLQAIQRRLADLLAAQGVTAFESRDKAFNPLWHEAVATGAAAGATVASGTIVDEVARGWRWGDELLRPARVRVAP